MTQKIGFIGYSSHAERFSEILNLGDHVDYWPDSGASVCAIWEENPERAARAAEYGKIPLVASSPEQVVAESDLVLLIARDPGAHLELAHPVIEAGKPVFVDKPMVRTPDDARELLSLVREAGIPMASFTTLRYGSDTERYAEGFRSIGPVRYASYVGPAHRTHPYGGFEFYAVHSVEVMLQFHGTDVVSVQATEHRPGADRSNTVATCAFGDGTLVTLGLVGDGAYHFRMTAIGRDGVVDVARAMYPESVDATGLAGQSHSRQRCRSSSIGPLSRGTTQNPGGAPRRGAEPHLPRGDASDRSGKRGHRAAPSAAGLHRPEEPVATGRFAERAHWGAARSVWPTRQRLFVGAERPSRKDARGRRIG